MGFAETVVFATGDGAAAGGDLNHATSRTSAASNAMTSSRIFMKPLK